MCFYQFKVPSEWAQLYAMTMKFDEIMDDMAHEFLLVRVKRELDEVNDPESLRHACLLLIDLLEKQKATFKQMLYSLIENHPEA